MRRHFLGNTQCATALIADWCQAKWQTSLPAGVVFCIPTALAGRRLRDMLAERYGAFQGVRFITPIHLLDLFDPSTADNIATPTEVLLTWDKVFVWLQSNDPEHLVSTWLFPGERRWLDSPSSRLTLAESLQALRTALSEVALDCHTLLATDAFATLDNREQHRWQALELLEAKYRELLSASNRIDPIDHQVACFHNGKPLPQESGELHVVMACVPDFLPALTALIDRLPSVDILVAAETTQAETFDAYGRPLPAYWNAPDHPLAVQTSSLHPCAQPDEAAALIDTFLKSFHSIAPHQLCLGILDRKMMPAITTMMARHGITLFEPESVALVTQPPGRALLALIAFARRRDADTLASLIDIPELHEALGTSQEAVRNTFAERNTDFFSARLSEAPKAADYKTFFTAVTQWANALPKTPTETARLFLTTLWGKRTLHPTLQPLLYATFEALQHLFQELHQAQGDTTALSLELLAHRLQSEAIRPVRRSAELSYEGRLEWLWSPAEIMILAGLNETLFPDSVMAHPFLPNTLREQLGMRADATRAARDAYLLDTLCRRLPAEKLCLIPTATNAAGDLLQPSRLLFRCTSEARAQRAERLFLCHAPLPPTPTLETALSPITPIDRWGEWMPQETFSSSAITLFLASPESYFLQRLLHLKEPTEPAFDGIAANHFGTLIHDILARAFTMTSSHDAAALIEAVMQQLHSTLQARYTTPFTLEVEALRNDLKRRLISMCTLEQHFREEGWSTCYTEKQWSAPIEVKGERLTLTGIIDRIDRKGDTWRILDYKTGSSAQNANAKHYKVDQWHTFQLPIYEYLLRANIPEIKATDTIELGYLFLPQTGGAMLSPFRYPKGTTYEDMLAVLRETLSRMRHPTLSLTEEN